MEKELIELLEKESNISNWKKQPKIPTKIQDFIIKKNQITSPKDRFNYKQDPDVWDPPPKRTHQSSKLQQKVSLFFKFTQ